MTQSTSERSAAYGVIAVVIILLLAMFWPSGGTPAPAPAYAAQPIIATPTRNPAFTPRPELPRDGAHALAVQPTPIEQPAGGVTAPAVAEPASQLIYASDGSATLAGVDSTWSAPPEPTAVAQPVAPISAELYKSLPVAGEPPADGGRPMTHGRGK
jgi:hypothetical protein